MARKLSKKASAMLWGIIAVVIVIIVIVAIFIFVGMMNNSNKTNSGPTGNVISPVGTVEVVKTTNSNLGKILVNNNGMTLYMFKADTSGKSNCYGTCASFWPPLLIDSEYTPTGEEVTGNLGETQRTDGTTQVTINEMPLYTFIQDKVPGDVKGQGVNASGGLWYVVSSSGQIITASPATASSTSSSGYYGSGSSSGKSSTNSSSSSTSGSSSGY
jgi:predicted lipoprotein with Yx(FWY)xxD motif